MQMFPTFIFWENDISRSHMMGISEVAQWLSAVRDVRDLHALQSGPDVAGEQVYSHKAPT